jgi:hypothetical protein
VPDRVVTRVGTGKIAKVDTDGIYAIANLHSLIKRRVK